MNILRPFTENEIEILKSNGCSAERWDSISVASDLKVERLKSVHFFGDIVLGSNLQSVLVNGVEKPCGIFNATLVNCHIGDNVYISNVGSSIQNYFIKDNVIIENISLLAADENAQFGNGVNISVLNEAGGREVTLFNDLNAQTAYLQAIYRHDVKFQNRLDQIVQKACESEKTARGEIGRGARIQNCSIIRNVHVGREVCIFGATELNNGTVLSCPEHPTFIGSGTIIKDFIVAEGATVKDGAILERVFVGQGVQLGKQFSAENTVLFANSEGFHSEVCSVFAGPYTVTHHKSTLLIGCLFSFYNAGSGTNQSNHMYKLGPVHQGILERGCKTGSFSYLLLESHIPAFSVVIGKHMTNVNIPDFPFSYLSEKHGSSNLVPGKNLFSIGTARDGAKWPSRDRRKSPKKRDLIIFDVFSPYTVEKMRKGRTILQELYADTPKGEESVNYGGVQIRRLLLRKGAKYYQLAIDRYLIDRVLKKIEEQASQSSFRQVLQKIKIKRDYAHPDKWVDIAGLIVLSERIEKIMEEVSAGKIAAADELIAKLQQLHASYPEDEWAYVCYAFKQEYGIDVSEISIKKMTELIDQWSSAASSLSALIAADAKIEYGDFARIGFGLGWDEEQAGKDFQAVRGTLESNSTIQNCEADAEQVKDRATKLKNLMASFS